MINHTSNGVYARPAYSDAQYFSGFLFTAYEGNYLVWLDMFDLTKTTRDFKRALICTLEQAKNVRRKYPNAKKMKLVRNALQNRPARD